MAGGGDRGFWGQSSRDREDQGPQGRSRHVSEDLEGYEAGAV